MCALAQWYDPNTRGIETIVGQTAQDPLGTEMLQAHCKGRMTLVESFCGTECGFWQSVLLISICQ